MYNARVPSTSYLLARRRFWEDPELGEWVSLLRAAAHERRLTQTQRAALDALGFSWKLSTVGASQHSPPPPPPPPAALDAVAP